MLAQLPGFEPVFPQVHHGDKAGMSIPEISETEPPTIAQACCRFDEKRPKLSHELKCMLVIAGPQIAKQAMRTKVRIALFASLGVGRAIVVSLPQADENAWCAFPLYESNALDPRTAVVNSSGQSKRRGNRSKPLLPIQPVPQILLKSAEIPRLDLHTPPALFVGKSSIPNGGAKLRPSLRLPKGDPRARTS